MTLLERLLAVKARVKGRGGDSELLEVIQILIDGFEEGAEAPASAAAIARAAEAARDIGGEG